VTGTGPLEPPLESPLGVVLCGGASRRMGADKSILEYEGVPMARRVAEALAAGGCGDVVAVGGAPEALAALGLRVVPDARPGEGPLAAIASAVSSAGARAMVVAACDLPKLTGGVVARTLAALRAGRGAAMATSDGRHALCVALTPEAARSLVSLVAAGERSLGPALATIGASPVEVDAELLVNVNTPDDVRQ